MQNRDSNPAPSGTISRAEILGYSLGAVGSNIIYALVATYLIVFYTESFGLKAAAVGTLFLVVRVWDAVFDVLIGIAVDNTETRWGKFRPYLLFGGFLVSLSAAACFMSPDFSESGKLIYAYCTYLVWSMSYSVVDIPYWSLTPSLSENPEERTRITSFSRTGAQIGYWIVSVGTLPVIAWLNTHGIRPLGLDGWALAGITAGVLCCICFLITFASVRERCVVPRKEKQTFSAVIHLLIHNAPLRYLMMACFFLEAVSAIRGTFAVYYFKYYLGREDLIPHFMAVNFTLVIVGCIAAPAICSRIGKVNAALYSYLLLGLLTVLMFLLKDSLLGVLVLTAFIGFFDGISNIGRMSCLADCVDYGEWKTGNRAEGMVFSTNIFKTKVAGAVSGAVTGYLLAGIGFTANVAQGSATLHWMAMFFTVILGLASIIAILPLFRYELTEKRFAELKAQHDIADSKM